MHSRTLLLLFVSLAACGGGNASTSTTTTTSGAAGAPHPVGACYTASLGICQYYYPEDGEELADAEASCTHPELADAVGTWGPDCPAGGRIGECADGNGNAQGRYYEGGSLYANAEAAETACEAGGGTWAP